MKKIAITRKVHVKRGNDIIDVPIETIKSILSDVGYTGNLLLHATNLIFHEATRLARKGVVSAADFEKAIVNAIKRTNDTAMNTTKKIVKRVVK